MVVSGFFDFCLGCVIGINNYYSVCVFREIKKNFSHMLLPARRETVVAFPAAAALSLLTVTSVRQKRHTKSGSSSCDLMCAGRGEQGQCSSRREGNHCFPACRQMLT